MKKFLFSTALLLALGSLFFGSQALAARSSPKTPYHIMVNRKANTVTVYTLDEAGDYTVPLRAMVCSVGAPEKGRTPKGSFSVTGVKKEWCYMLDGTYGQYSTQFKGHYLFHSICYSQADPSTMLTEEYNMLGSPASMGCVRLQTADAKWIFDNCAAGTPVTIYDSDEPGPLGKPRRVVEYISPEADTGWDPTDPRENNPWRRVLVQDFSVETPELSLSVGDRQAIPITLTPETATYPEAVWTSGDPTVATVDGKGRVLALTAGTAVITGSRGDLSGQCRVTVTGQALPFSDVPPGSWYYPDIRYVYEEGLFSGSSATTFSPQELLTRAMALKLLYRLSGEPPVAPEDAVWFAGAYHWAEKEGLLENLDWSVNADLWMAATRQELMLLLYRYETLFPVWEAEGGASLSGFTDSGDVSPQAREAMSWAVGAGLLQGEAGSLLSPADLTTRSQAAAIFHRYLSR